MSLREILNGLNDHQRQALMVAFDSGIANHVEYKPGKFIGVHMSNPAANMRITEQVGTWCAGEIKHAEIK